MAYENIQIIQPNFCLGPQTGTICTIDTTNPQTVLRVKDTGGSSIIDLSLSSNILNDNVRLEYVGPNNLSSVVDDLTFFTFEKVNNTSCIIKRWQTRMSYRELLLKEQIVKISSGDEYYNAIDFAVEYYRRTFTQPNEYYNYLNMSSTTNIKNGTRLFLGPSTDTDNVGATETATVSHIIDYIGGKRVYLTAPLKYQYAIGDLITFYSHVYVYSSDGYGGDPNKGTLFKLDAYTWTTNQIDTKAIYKKITASKWCPMINGIASIVGTNILFVRPYDSYLNWRSLFMNNVKKDNNTVFQVYDLVFDDYSIYKLQKETTLKEDDGDRNTWYWDEYNIQYDTLSPYTNSMTTWLDQSVITGYNKNVDINVRVRDQYHVGLKDVYINFYKEGDEDALFDPLSGAVTTDSNGETSINYRSGATYTGHTKISAKATGSSTFTGSQYVWTSNNIISFPEVNPVDVLMFQKKETNGTFNLKQIYEYFKVYEKEYENGVFKGIISVYPYTLISSKSFFTTPGGNWGNFEEHQDLFASPSMIETWLPMLYLGPEKQRDSIRFFSGGGFSNWPYSDVGESFFIGNQVRILENFDIEKSIKSITDFYLYESPGGEQTAYHPYVIIVQPDETGSLQLSQLKLSLHTHWMDGEAYDELITYVNIDQFVFVEDAVPAYWSSKNPVDTNIWIRLRPYAFSLDNSTLRMWVREVSYNRDTGYYEVTSNISLTNFDAGSGLLGIEVTYDPQQDFLYGSMIFVRIEVYDVAYIPNFIYTEYWFNVIPDYKAPYLINLSPSREETNVSVDTNIYFEIKDAGAGIDLSTLECFLNSRRMLPEHLNIEIVSNNHFKITYTPPEHLYFDKDYKVTVKVQDTSLNENKLNDSYMFYTTLSNGVLIIDPSPGICKAGMNRFEDVSAKVLAYGNGVDLDSVRLQVFNKDVNPKIVPIVYRIS